MRWVMCAVPLVAVGCHTGAPEGGPRENGPFPTSSGISDTHQLLPPGNSTGRANFTTTADLGLQTYLSVPVDTAFTALKKGYLSLGLEITKQDPAEHVVGNSRVVVLHKMMGRNLSAFLNCGPDAVMGWPRADHYQVIFSILSTLTARDSGHTRLVTLVTAEASDMATSASGIYCSSAGVLETALLNAAGYQPD
jgi:hypothetical protein